VRKPLQSWEELEQVARIRRTVPNRPTQRDVTNLTVRRLRGPFWRFKRR
jgi:hypothetical protein